MGDCIGEGGRLGACLLKLTGVCARVAHFALFVWLCMETDVRRKRETRMRLEALLLRCDGPDEQGEMATDSGVDVGGMSRVRTKRAERMAAEELSW